MNQIKKSITPENLFSVIYSEKSPILIDTRKAPDFIKADRMIAGASWNDHMTVGEMIADIPDGKDVIIYCVHGHQVSQSAVALIQAKGVEASIIEGGFDAWEIAGGTTVSREKIVEYQGRPWVTRENPKIDRIACPWLIRRFIDFRAEIHFVAADWVRDIAKEFGGTAFDIDAQDITFTHVGENCSFDAFIKHFDIRDPALARMAMIIRGADTGRLDLAPQAAGLAAFSIGMSALYNDDQEMLDKGMLLYDSLYAWCRETSDKNHKWTGNHT